MKYDINKADADDRNISPSLRTKGQGPEINPSNSSHPLESPDAQKRFRQLQQWRRQARVAQADNRMEMAIDEDFYDNIQLEPEDLKILRERNQPDITYNVVKNNLNFILGTERRSRIDYRVLPRKKNGAAEAKVKTKGIKYIQDICKGEFERSQAFTEAACAGLGWLEFGVRQRDEPIFWRAERWRNMWYDHLDTSMDGSLMRFVIREKWLDLDVGQALFPDRADELKVLAEGVNSLYPYLPDDVVVTDNASEFDLESDLDSLFGGPFDGMRERIKMIEMQYRVPEQVKIMHMRDEDTPYGTLDGVIYRPDEPDHQYMVKGGYFTTTDALKMVVRHAIWAGNTLLQDKLSPFNHNRFTFVPIYCYRRKRDNLPYGIIRDIRGPQIGLNRKKLRVDFLLAANQIVTEKGAVDDKVEFHSEMQKPDGIAEVNEGKMGAWKQIDHRAQVSDLAKLAEEDERFIHSISGVTADADWQDRKDLSGKAMNIQQNQQMTGHGIIFDNYYYAVQAGGEIVLTNMEQFWDKQKEIRITGDQQKDEFVEINKQKEDGTIENSITAMKADFIVSKQDYRETIRLSMVEQLLKLITELSKTNPQVALSLLDLAVELMDDLPNKEEAVARIRKINGQHAPEDEMSDEEKAQVKKAEQQRAQEQEIMKQLQQALIKMKLAEGQGKVDKDKAEAISKKLDAFLKALEAAAYLSNIPHLAQAADQLVLEAQNIGGNGGQQGQ